MGIFLLKAPSPILYIHLHHRSPHVGPDRSPPSFPENHQVRIQKRVGFLGQRPERDPWETNPYERMVKFSGVEACPAKPGRLHEVNQLEREQDISYHCRCRCHWHQGRQIRPIGPQRW